MVLLVYGADEVAPDKADKAASSSQKLRVRIAALLHMREQHHVKCSAVHLSGFFALFPLKWPPPPSPREGLLWTYSVHSEDRITSSSKLNLIKQQPCRHLLPKANWAVGGANVHR